jgi:hypothetical protein
MIESRATPLCQATARRMEANVPSPERGMLGHDDSLVRGIFGLQDDLPENLGKP